MDVQLRVDQIQELLHISQQFLTDAFARAVDAEFHPGCAEEDRRRKQAHRDRLANCSVCVNFIFFKKI
jgi:hypothetical protein